MTIASGRLGPAVLAATAVVGMAVAVGLDLAVTSSERAVADSGLGAVTGLSGALLLIAAAVVLANRPHDTVGRVVGVVGVVWLLDGVMSAWGVFAYSRELPGVELAFWFVWRFGAVLLSGLTTVLLLYPTGRLLPGRWRPVSVAVLVAAYALPLALLLAPDSLVVEGGPPGVRTEQLALPIPESAAEVLLRSAQLATFGSLLGAVALLWVRHRIAEADDRRRIRWLLWAGILIVLMVVVAALLALGGVVLTVVLSLAVATLAISLAVGLVRPDLADVDGLVAWTATSAAVAGVLVALDVALLALGNQFLGERLDERDVTVVVLVLAVLAYGPLRSLIGSGVRRALVGRRADRYGVISDLTARLDATTSADDQLGALAKSVAAAFKLDQVRVEVVAPDGSTLIAGHGTADGDMRRQEISYRGERIGALETPADGVRTLFSRRDQALLIELVRQAAVAIRAGLLAVELQTSRERLVLAREEDRRRIRRDLHDGLGPVMGGVTLRLDAAGNAIPHDPDRARELVRLARTEVADALADVRRLVHDLRPPALDDLGLEAALRQQADRLAGSMTVTLDASGLAGTSAASEVAVYRIVSEALTNVARHAVADHVRICVTGGETGVRIEVTDDGRGIDEAVAAGVGLLSIRERAEELGGTCEVRCPAAGGTALTAWLPNVRTREEAR